MAEKKSPFDERETEEYLVHSHNERTESLGDWKDRISAARAMVKGEMPYTNPDGVVVMEPLQITNLADTMPRDTARMVSEVEPSYRAPVTKLGEPNEMNADVRSAIAHGYFSENRFDVLRPMLSMDLDVAGACFVCSWADLTRRVPRFDRIDPLFAYPDIYNGELLDLLVVQQMKLRTARMVFKGYDFDEGIFSSMQDSDDVTVMDYYGPTHNGRAVGRTGTDGSKMLPGKLQVMTWVPHGCDRPTVGFAMLPSPTGEFHGSVDQIGKGMATKNRIVNLITEYAHEAIYAPWEERGIMNWKEDPGPDTKYHHNPNLDGQTFMRRVAPAPVNAELFGLLSFLEGEQRGQLGYPETRQGNVGVSQGSSSFVTATQGQLTSIVRERQRLLSGLQEDLCAVAFQQDKLSLDFDKSLPFLVADKRSYRPSKDIGDNYEIRVEYGAGAGLDRINADQRLVNFNSLGTLSKQTVLEQSDIVGDARGELQQVQNEEIDRILLEKWLSDPAVTADIIGMTLKLKKDRGISLSEAWAEVQHAIAQTQAEQAAAQAEAQQPVAPEGGAPATQPAPQPTPEFAKTVMPQAFLGR